MSQGCPSCESLRKDVHTSSVDTAVLKNQVASLETVVRELKDTVKNLDATLNQSKGGWFVLTAVASLGATVATVVAAVVGWISG